MHEPTCEVAPRHGDRRAASALHVVDDLPSAWQALAFDLLFPPVPSGAMPADRRPADAVRRSELARTA